VTVTAFDQYGNVVTGYTGTVRFKSSDWQQSLPTADYTFDRCDHGVTFHGRRDAEDSCFGIQA